MDAINDRHRELIDAVSRATAAAPTKANEKRLRWARVHLFHFECEEGLRGGSWQLGDDGIPQFSAGWRKSVGGPAPKKPKTM